jgi:hypothetical protein
MTTETTWFRKANVRALYATTDMSLTPHAAQRLCHEGVQ